MVKHLFQCNHVQKSSYAMCIHSFSSLKFVLLGYPKKESVAEEEEFFRWGRFVNIEGGHSCYLFAHFRGGLTFKKDVTGWVKELYRG